MRRHDENVLVWASRGQEGWDHGDSLFLLATRAGTTQHAVDGGRLAVVAARFTRARAVWAATGVALLLLILLIVFMLQNSTKVDVHFLGMSGSIPLGMAVLIAAVGGGVVVAIAGIARVTELRMGARRRRRGTTGA